MPVWTPPGVDPDAKGGTVMKPDWDGMDPKSREYACVVHGECGDARRCNQKNMMRNMCRLWR